MPEKVGVLLVNLGSPTALTTRAIRQFLRPFLMDRRVIDLPWLLRAIIVYGLVLPFRPKKLIDQYAAIWMAEGSPLHVYSQSLVNQLGERLPGNMRTALAMRYGEPDLSIAIESLMVSGIDRLIVLPLYAQYASSTTGSTLAEIFRILSSYRSVPAVDIIPPFYNDERYIQAQSQLYSGVLNNEDIDHLLFSYHGLPVSHIRDDERHHLPVCEQQQPCPIISDDNAYCYRAQCYQTSRLLAVALDWPSELCSTAFQSRFGKNPWIAPVTEQQLAVLYQRGVRRLAIATPAFSSDCLETLEEIVIRARQQWLNMGGKALICLPCLNDSPLWVETIVYWLGRRIDNAD